MNIDCSLILNVHREGKALIPSLLSLGDVVETAKASGLTLEVLAVLDEPDVATQTVLGECAHIFDGVHQVRLGDLGQARNFGIDRAQGQFVAVLDGDDLWCSDWVVKARAEAERDSSTEVILHPEFAYFFDAADEDLGSPTSHPASSARSFVMTHRSSDDPKFDRSALLFNNVWTSNSFARRETFLAHPYKKVDAGRGTGFEDWSWNAETLVAGFVHRIVPGTVHMVRIKHQGSLGSDNARQGLLPVLPDGLRLPRPS